MSVWIIVCVCVCVCVCVLLPPRMYIWYFIKISHEKRCCSVGFILLSLLFSVLCVLKTECSFSLSFMRSRIYTTLQSQLQWDAYPLLYSYNEISTSLQLQWDIYCSSVTLRWVSTSLQLQWDIYCTTLTVIYCIYCSTLTVRYLPLYSYTEISSSSVFWSPMLLCFHRLLEACVRSVSGVCVCV